MPMQSRLQDLVNQAQRSIATTDDFEDEPVTRGMVVRAPWAGHLASDEKSWEIRGKPTRIRGPVAIIQGGSGLVLGVAELVDCVGPLNRLDLKGALPYHLDPDIDGTMELYDAPYAWVFRKAVRFEKPVPYTHPSGAVIWVTLDDAARRGIARATKLANGGRTRKTSRG